MAENFSEKLAALCSAELVKARREPDRAGAMIERLCGSLGLTLAVTTGGDAAKIDKLIQGCEGQIHAAAVQHGEFARFIASLPKAP
jgi:hypothetical protein